MKTIIQGKNLKTTYGVNYKWKSIKNDKNEDITVYIGKPELTKETVVDNWETIFELDEKLDYNKKSSFNWNTIVMFDNKLGYINISEEESVGIIETITRVDLGTYVLHTDKVLNEEVINKEESEDILACQIRAFNKMMIESNAKLLGYCHLHTLVPEYTDVDELFKIVYPKQSYKIIDGKLIADENSFTSSNIGTIDRSISYLYNARYCNPSYIETVVNNISQE